MKTSAEIKAMVLEAFDTLFNKRDYEKAATFWSPDYIQHSAHIPPGRDGLFNLVREAPPTLRYVNSLIVVDGNDVMLHGKFTGRGSPRAWVAADVLKIENGLLKEHWDVLADEATAEESVSGSLASTDQIWSFPTLKTRARETGLALVKLRRLSGCSRPGLQPPTRFGVSRH
jgi:predicted SnoaL-like aldol condensation-catalyzing enzyme